MRKDVFGLAWPFLDEGWRVEQRDEYRVIGIAGREAVGDSLVNGSPSTGVVSMEVLYCRQRVGCC